MTNSLYSHYRRWQEKPCLAEKGFIVGCDISQEWLLKWWFSHYQRHNSLPVAFVDFGMSEEMKKWCQHHGHFIPLFVADIFVREQSELNTFLIESMQAIHGKSFWVNRSAWFKKPLACLQSPFKKSLWIDLDCQINGCLNLLFEFCNEHLAIAKDVSGTIGSTLYNSGVLGFKKGLSLIELWADHCFEYNHLYPGDQDVLNAILKEKNITITEIPSIYNWSRSKEKNCQAVILHWHGPQGKAHIAHQIANSNLSSLGFIEN